MDTNYERWQKKFDALPWHEQLRITALYLGIAALVGSVFVLRYVERVVLWPFIVDEE